MFHQCSNLICNKFGGEWGWGQWSGGKKKEEEANSYPLSFMKLTVHHKSCSASSSIKYMLHVNSETGSG